MTGEKIDANAYVLSKLKNNLLAVIDVIKSLGPLIFTAKRAYTLSPQFAANIRPTAKIPKFQHGMYVVHGSVNTNSQAVQARTEPHHIPSKTRQPTTKWTTESKHIPAPAILHQHNLNAPPAYKEQNEPEIKDEPMNVAVHKLHTWNLRLNHAHPSTIRKALLRHEHPDDKLVHRATLSCSGYHTGKLARASQRPSYTLTRVGTVLCTDVMAQIHPPGLHGEKFIMTFTDLSSRFTFVIALKTKAEVTQAIKAALMDVRNTRGDVPRVIHSDNAKEYLAVASVAAAHQFGVTTRTTAPYNPEENGVAERINRTLLKAARAVLATAHMALHYWPMAVANVVFKNNLLVHSTTDRIPLHEWSGTVSPIPTLYVFGQMGRIPNLPLTVKLQDRCQVARYIYTESTKHIKVQLQNGRFTKVRIGDFHPIINNRDPSKTHRHAFASILKRLTVVPTVIKSGTPPPVNLNHARRYPDSSQWQIAHDQALQKLEMERVVDWTQPAPKGEKPLQLTISYTYKWQPDGTLQSRKARCSVRGDLMKPGIHFDPHKVQYPTTEKTTIRLLFAMAAAHGWHLEHMNIVNAYIHEPPMHHRPIYVRRLRTTPGENTQCSQTGVLKRNLWGGKSAGHDYIQALFKFLKTHDYKPAVTDPCLFVRKAARDTTIVAITVDDLLVIANRPQLLDDFYTMLASK